MSVPKHLKEHEQVDVMSDPYNFITGELMKGAEVDLKMLAVGATLPFDVDAQDGAIGEGGSCTAKLRPQIYPFIFPKAGTFDLINFGLGDNTVFNADRLRIAFWDMNGTLLHEHTHDFNANLVNTWTTTIHRNPAAGFRLPRAFLMGFYPELQSDDTAAASLIFASSSSYSTSSFGLSNNFSAAGSPKTETGRQAMGFYPDQDIARPLVWGNLNAPWTCVADTVTPIQLYYGVDAPVLGGRGYQYAVRVAMNLK